MKGLSGMLNRTGALGVIVGLAIDQFRLDIPKPIVALVGMRTDNPIVQWLS
jgi:hypothetical protein